MKSLLLVFLGGGLGSTLRYVVGKFMSNTPLGFPYGTFTVNVLGSLFIGVILGLVAKNNSISENTMLFLATGFCGGFTTFSTFAYENHELLKNGDYGILGLYTVGSFALGLLAVFFGMWVVRFF